MCQNNVNGAFELDSESVSVRLACSSKNIAPCPQLLRGLEALYYLEALYNCQTQFPRHPATHVMHTN